MTKTADDSIPTAIALITASLNRDEKALKVALGDLEASAEVINLISALTHLATKLVHAQTILVAQRKGSAEPSEILQALAISEINKREANGDFS